MTKHEFLSIMEYELGNLSPNLKGDIISDFREHFDIALESGKREAEICALLGDPKEIAREFIVDYKNNKNENSNTAYESAVERREPAQSLITRLNADNIKHVVIEAISGDIRLEGKNSNEICVEFEGDYRDRFITEIHDNTYFLRERIHKQYYDNFLSRIARGFKNDIEINIFAPCKFIGSIEAKTASGDVEIKDFTELENLNLKTASGDICGKNTASFGKLNFSTGSGDIELKKCKGNQGIKISTGSGDINSRDSEGEFRASTGSGEIDVSSHTGTVTGSTGSGDINIITDELSTNLNYSTGSGDINISCGKISGNIKMSTGSGSIEIKTKELYADITAKTGSGDIDAKIGRENDVKFILKTGRHGEKNNEFTVLDAQRGGVYNRENAKYKVFLETHTGDIDVKAI